MVPVDNVDSNAGGRAQRQILLNMKSQCMNKSTFLANNATVMQLQREILKNTKSHYMKISKFLVHIEPMKLLQRDHL